MEHDMGILTSFIINHKPSVYHNFTKLKCLRAWACPRLIKSWHRRKTQIYNRMAEKAARNPNSLVSKILEKIEDVSIQSIRDKLIIHLHQNQYKLTHSLQWQRHSSPLLVFSLWGRQTKKKRKSQTMLQVTSSPYNTDVWEQLKKASKAPVSATA